MISTSSQSVSSNYSNQFIISSPERSLLGTVKESTYANITSMIGVQIQQEISSVLSAPLLNVLASVVPPTLTNPTPPPIPTTSTITTTEAPTFTFVNLKSEVPLAINEYLGSSLGDTLQKELQKHIEKLRQEYSHKKINTLLLDDQGLKKNKAIKDATSSKKSKSTGSSKDTTPSQPKSTSKYAQVEETVFEAEDINMPLNQGDDLGNTKE
ncbi:hypothetical protein Tco_1527864 [Tanacetum coccineum]